MSLTPIIRMTPTRLSPRPVDAILLAWMENADVQAVRRGEEETLWINGQLIALDPRVNLHAVQLVINLSTAGKRRRAEMIRDLLSLTAE